MKSHANIVPYNSTSSPPALPLEMVCTRVSSGSPTPSERRVTSRRFERSSSSEHTHILPPSICHILSRVALQDSSFRLYLAKLLVNQSELVLEQFRIIFLQLHSPFSHGAFVSPIVYIAVPARLEDSKHRAFTLEGFKKVGQRRRRLGVAWGIVFYRRNAFLSTLSWRLRNLSPGRVMRERFSFEDDFEK